MNIKELVLTPQEAFDEALFVAVLYKKLSIPRDGSLAVVPLKRSVDARGRNIVVRVQYDIVERANIPPRRTKDYPRSIAKIRSSSSVQARPVCSPRSD